MVVSPLSMGDPGQLDDANIQIVGHTTTGGQRTADDFNYEGSYY